MQKPNSSNSWVRFKPGYPAKFDPFRDSKGYYLDEKAGQEVIDFFSECLVHVKGSKALNPLELELWQQAIVAHLFGWKSKETHLRRFRELFAFVPRKNGKTILAAGISLYSLFCIPERGAEIYCAASDRSQARLLFDVAKMMTLKDHDLRKRAEVLRHEIRFPERDSVFKVISSEAASKHGYSSSLVVFDELHAIPDRELVDVLTTSLAARLEPMLVSISTAGYDQNSICFEKFDYARKVRDRVIHDPAFFPVIYQASESDDWADPKAWRRVNPNFEISISKDYLTREAERAKESPAYAAAFRRLHLNIWTEAETPFISLEDWDKCGKELPDLAGRRCFGGLDLSSTQDLTSFSLCFPPEGDGPYYLLSWGWIPEETMRKQRTSPYYQWVHQNYLEMIPGAVIEYAYIIEKITKLAEQYDIEAILFDRWGATAVYQELESRGMEMVGHGQGFKDQSQPTKELLKLVLSGKIVHGGHPVLRWCIANMVVETDAAGNLKPSRRRSTEKIDLAVSSIMALNGCLTNPVPEKEVSIYESRGLLII